MRSATKTTCLLFIIISQTLLCSLSLAQQSPQIQMFGKNEVKAGYYYSAKQPVTPASKFVFAGADMKGFIKVNGKIITLTHGSGDDSDSTSSSFYDGNGYTALIESRIVNGKKSMDPKAVWSRSVTISTEAGKVLFAGKIYNQEEKVVTTGYKYIDEDAFKKILNTISNKFRDLEKTPADAGGGYETKVTVFKDARIGDIIEDANIIVYQTYQFNTTPAISAAIKNEFLKIKKELAPFSEKEKTVTDKKATIVSYVYHNDYYFMDVELKMEKDGATIDNVITIEYDKQSEANGKQFLKGRILDSVLDRTVAVSSLAGEKLNTEKAETFYSIKRPFNVFFSGEYSTFLMVSGKEYSILANPKIKEVEAIPKLIYEVKKYMKETFGAVPTLVPGVSLQKPNELVFSKFLKSNPSVVVKVRYYLDGKGTGGSQFRITGPLSAAESAKIAAIGASAASNNVAAAERKPPLLKMFRDNNGLYGFRDYNNGLETVIPAKYMRVGAFADGLAPVSLDSEKWGYIDEKGNTVIPFKFITANEFRNGKARVEVGNLLDPVAYYIDKTGARVN